ncbi:RNA polymerase sigma factor [Planctomicrobium piriforme]|uniref:RNA polymerase sigma factor, sigma-70 family n=1 Tax=Planctomicrobium piriforme TaxID=1576369 RepID=A0A1I3IIG7_9PLAN|nr:ECF-type sigma factor [Planctomicrobium piriforme]SFI47721.1 RNA polymerase sigma factor, sigma-70 family [Planctomicrobium piriforme]
MPLSEAESRDVDPLLQRAEAGSESAFRQLLEHLSPPVYSSIRRRLARKVRQTVDSDDVAQSVWKSLLAKREALTGVPLKHLVRVAAKIASNKAIDAGRRIFAQRRGADRVVSVNPEQLSELPAAHPAASPSAELVARERLSAIIKTVPAGYAEVVRMLAQGASVEEASKAAGVPKRSLYRILQQARLRE